MGMEVDQQFFDLLTVIDNLMKKNNNLQEQNNALLQQTISLLGAILEKPAILEAPRLTELTIEQQANIIPSNTLVYPQFLYNSSSNKMYEIRQSIHLSSRLVLPRTDEYTTISLITIAPSPLLGISKFDLAKIRAYKLVGFNLYDESFGVPVVPLAQRDFSLSCDIKMLKNKSILLLHKDIIPEDDWVFTNQQNNDWDFIPKDTIEITGKNRNDSTDPDNTIYISFDWLLDTYQNISIERYKGNQRNLMKVLTVQ